MRGGRADQSYYGAPLVFFGTIALPAVTNGTVNDLISSYQLATPAALGANEDTIYSAAIYDLSQTDLTITLPPVDEDRYFNIVLYDP